MMPRMSWLDSRAFVATRATCRDLSMMDRVEGSGCVLHTQPATLTQPVIHERTGTHFGQETKVAVRDDGDSIHQLYRRPYLLLRISQ